MSFPQHEAPEGGGYVDIPVVADGGGRRHPAIHLSPLRLPQKGPHRQTRQNRQIQISQGKYVFYTSSFNGRCYRTF